MQGLQIPISGGTTPEESDAKPIFLDEDDIEESIEDWTLDNPWEN